MRHISKLFLLSLLGCCLSVAAQKPSDTPASQMEKLDRGLIVFPYTTGKYFVSWRLLGTDDNNTTFELLKNGESLKKDIYQATSMSVSGSATDTYQIVTYQNGKVVETTDPVKPWDKYYLELKLDQKAIKQMDLIPEGIELIHNEAAEMPIYDLYGRQLSAPKKGFNVINGKLILIK